MFVPQIILYSNHGVDTKLKFMGYCCLDNMNTLGAVA